MALRNDNNLQSWWSWDCKVGHNNNTMLTCYPHFIFLADMIAFYYYACSWTNIVSLLLSVTSSLFAQEVHFAVYELDFTDCENKHAELCLRWPGPTSRGMGSADIGLTRPGPCFSFKTMLLRVISAQSIHNVNTFMRQLSRTCIMIVQRKIKDANNSLKGNSYWEALPLRQLTLTKCHSWSTDNDDKPRAAQADHIRDFRRFA